MTLEDLQSYTDDETGVTLTHDHYEDDVALGYWRDGDQVVGKLELAQDGDDLEVRFISLGAAAGQGILGRYIYWLLTEAKNAGMATVWADALDAAATVAKYHGSEQGEGFRWTCDLSSWKRPKTATKDEWKAENPRVDIEAAIEQAAEEEAGSEETP